MQMLLCKCMYLDKRAMLMSTTAQCCCNKIFCSLATQKREQMSGPDIHVFTLKILVLKKPGFSPIKYTLKKFSDFFYLYSM